MCPPFRQRQVFSFAVYAGARGHRTPKLSNFLLSKGMLQRGKLPDTRLKFQGPQRDVGSQPKSDCFLA